MPRVCLGSSQSQRGVLAGASLAFGDAMLLLTRISVCKKESRPTIRTRFPSLCREEDARAPVPARGCRGQVAVCSCCRASSCSGTALAALPASPPFPGCPGAREACCGVAG